MFVLQVIAGLDVGLDYRQPEGLQAPTSYTNQVIVVIYSSNTSNANLIFWVTFLGLRNHVK